MANTGFAGIYDVANNYRDGKPTTRKILVGGGDGGRRNKTFAYGTTRSRDEAIQLALAWQAGDAPRAQTRPYHTATPTEARVLAAAESFGLIGPPKTSIAVRRPGAQKEGPGVVYLIRVTGGYIKLGETRGNPRDRIAQGQTWHVDDLELLVVIGSEKRLELEAKLHAKYDHLRLSSRELFDPAVLHDFPFEVAREVDGELVELA